VSLLVKFANAWFFDPSDKSLQPSPWEMEASELPFLFTKVDRGDFH
jgi:hypothetical protein